MITKLNRRIKIKKRIRGKISGTEQRPRLSVFRSNSFIYGQLIDDNTGKTLFASSSLKIEKGTTKVEQAAVAGKEIAQQALAAGIAEIVFDRNGYLYHGRVKAFADGARAGGLKF